MLADRWAELLTLMSYVVLADHRIYHEEVEVFTSRAVELKAQISPDMLFSKKMAFDWFVTHREAVRAVMTGPDARQHVMRSIQILADYDNLKPVWDVMEDIANADGHYHKSEINITDLAAQHWNIKRG